MKSRYEERDFAPKREQKKILFIGGSPCSGKSTVAERIAREFDAYYFKADDFADQWIGLAAEMGRPACQRQMNMTPDEIWMREPCVQCEREFLIYDEISDLLFAHLDGICADRIVTEGAAYTPKIARTYGCRNYIAIVPSKSFQITHYRERNWIERILRGCSNPQEAFHRWMERDALFAQQVEAECRANGVPCIVTDETTTPEETFRRVCSLFHLQ